MQTFSQFLEIVEKNIQNTHFNKEIKELYAPIHYILGLPAKRVRPALMLLSYQMYKETYNEVLPIAFAIEAFHNFTLIHDDIMDKAPLRRGKPTVHEVYGQNSAILSGDVLLIYVYEILRKNIKHQKLDNVLACFNQMAIKVCEGQQLDMDFEKIEKLQMEQYIQMIRYKTAELLGATIKIGLLCGDAPDLDCHLGYELGINLGIAFQIQDDYLDIYGDNFKVGKQKAGDIINGKKSAPYILALESLAEEEIESFIQFYASTEIDSSLKIKNVMAVYERLDIPEKILKLKSQFQSKAYENLSSISVSEENKKEMLVLVHSLFERNI